MVGEAPPNFLGQAFSATGVLGERFGLPAVFVALGMGAAALAFWLARVVGAWSRKPIWAVASPFPDSGPGGR